MSLAAIFLSTLFSAEAIWEPVGKSEDGVPVAPTLAAYDTNRQRIVAFYNYEETWEFSLTTRTWSNRSPPSRMPPNNPRARYWPSLAFAAGKNVTLLFGGQTRHDFKYQTDLWQWDGSRWTELTSSSPAPHPRQDAGFVYDEARGRAVLVAGKIPQPAAGPADPAYVRAQKTTWEWDGQRWWEFPDSAAPTGAVQLVYDPAAKRVLLYAHDDDPGAIWQWQGGIGRWSKLGSVALEFLDCRYPAVTYDPVRRRLVLFGGVNANGVSSDVLYEWDESTKVLSLFPKTGLWPAARSEARLFHDPKSENLLLYAGRFKLDMRDPPSYFVFRDVWTMYTGNFPDGASCAAAAADRCANRSCVDGVCCASRSCNPCQSCGLAGSEGRCANLPDGTSDPDGCAAPQVCDGAGRCRDSGGAPPRMDASATPTDARPASSDGAGGAGAGGGSAGGAAGGGAGTGGGSRPDAAVTPGRREAGAEEEEAAGGRDGGARVRRRLYAGGTCALTPRAAEWPSLLTLSLTGLWLVRRRGGRGVAPGPRPRR